MTPALRLVAGTAAFFGLVAAAPNPGDFAIAAQFAAAVLSGTEIRATPELLVTGGPTPQPLALADYRRQRSECELSRLIRLQGDSEIGIEWRCGQLYARLNDVYTIADGRVARVLANVPILIMAPRQQPEPR